MPGFAVQRCDEVTASLSSLAASSLVYAVTWHREHRLKMFCWQLKSLSQLSHQP